MTDLKSTDVGNLSGGTQDEGQKPESTSPWPLRKIKRLFVPLALVGIILFGLFLRVEDFGQWLDHKEDTFFNDKPLLGALDGYFYLRLSRDLLEGSYDAHDSLRNAPKGFVRPAVPPMLSYVTAGICRLTGWHLDWVGFFLPAILGALIAIPLFAFGRYMSCSVGGIAAALLGVSASYAVYRGGMGWFDTDCLNVTWSLAISYCFMRFGLGSSLHLPDAGKNLRSFMRIRGKWLVAGLIFVIFFFWWWDQSPGAVAILSGIPLITGLALFIASTKRRKLLAFLISGVLAVLVLLVLFGLGDGAEDMLVLAKSQYKHITKQPQGEAPSFALSISEQSKPSFGYIVQATTASIPVFFAAIFGIIVLIVRKPKAVVFLLPIIFLGVLSVAFSSRFLIFLSPLLALGFGQAIGCVWRIKWHQLGFRFGAIVAIIVALFFSFSMLMSGVTAWPKTDAARVAGMAQLAEHTPVDAVIWSWWDNGYAINYFARRATIHDGQLHGVQQSRDVATSLSTHDPALASLFIRLYVAKGPAGIKSIPESKRNDPNAYSVPSEAPSVYLYLDSLMMSTLPIWFGFADEYRDRPPVIYQPVFDLVLGEDRCVYRGGERILDADAGVFRWGSTRYALKQFMVREARRAWIQTYEREKGGCFEFMAPRGFGALMEKSVTESIFNRLFIRVDPKLGQWFDPIIVNSPDFQIWEVVTGN